MEIVEIPGFTTYGVSADGKVWNMVMGHELSPVPTPSGRLKVRLYRNKAVKTCYVHRLVAEVFLDDFYEGKKVVHVDGDFSNNHVDNLYVSDVRCRKGELWR